MFKIKFYQYFYFHCVVCNTDKPVQGVVAAPVNNVIKNYSSSLKISLQLTAVQVQFCDAKNNSLI